MNVCVYVSRSLQGGPVRIVSVGFKSDRFGRVPSMMVTAVMMMMMTMMMMTMMMMAMMMMTMPSLRTCFTD